MLASLEGWLGQRHFRRIVRKSNSFGRMRQDIVLWQSAETLAIILRELRWALITNAIAGLTDTERVHQQQLSGFVKAYSALVLNRRHSCHSLEMLMERRWTHPNPTSKIAHQKALRELLLQPGERPGDAIGWAVLPGDFQQPRTGRSCKQPIQNLLPDQRRQRGGVPKSDTSNSATQSWLGNRPSSSAASVPLRTVPATLPPRSRMASAMLRPRPRLIPVTNQVEDLTATREIACECLALMESI